MAAQKNSKKSASGEQSKSANGKVATRAANGRRRFKYYNMEMIEDFLFQLIVELKLQHARHADRIRSLVAGDPLLDDPNVVVESESPFATKLLKLWRKYRTTLLASATVDLEGASDSMIRAAKLRVLELQLQNRERQIESFENLFDLFNEAIWNEQLTPHKFKDSEVPMIKNRAVGHDAIGGCYQQFVEGWLPKYPFPFQIANNGD